MVKKAKKPSVFKRYTDIIRNGLFLFGIRNRLDRMGININPYYWVQEEFVKCELPELRNDHSANYTFKHLTIEDVTLIAKDKGPVFNKMIEGLKNGQTCVGLENNGEVACYTFIEFNSFDFNGRWFDLKPNEAYLLNMWTFHKYRGKNLAPYLRYQVYRMLEKKGVDVKYSISQYFNKSSIKFKRKLNSKHHFLYLNIVLFKKLKWNFTLKKYN